MWYSTRSPGLVPSTWLLISALLHTSWRAPQNEGFSGTYHFRYRISTEAPLHTDRQQLFFKQASDMQALIPSELKAPSCPHSCSEGTSQSPGQAWTPGKTSLLYSSHNLPGLTVPSRYLL